ncbi:MAG: hypothetical protein U1E02_09110 [Hydrogenophaga sp.]|nr:hypothetical protein [Burkholderiaceae bacterium]MDZ4124320.1 hypothetical protein [Hydrogenophaga sp.]
MPVRRLVELDGEYGGWLEIDPVKLKRVATEFKSWLLTVDPNNDPFGFLMRDLPLVEAALTGSLKLPSKNYPHAKELGEGWLPDDYCEISAPFYNTIHGALYAPPEVIQKDGKYYAWCEFEDPPQDAGQ